jgi:hypothetical protein
MTTFADRAHQSASPVTGPGLPGTRRKLQQSGFDTRKPTALNEESPLAAAPTIVREALGSTGQPLDSGARTLMEARYGHDFGSVRIHADERAAAAASAVHARAFAAGNDVVFGRGRYEPGKTAGVELLAHELGHVVEQRRSGQLAVARQPLEQYETERITFKPETMAKAAEASYWFTLVMETYDLTLQTARLHADPEERDAVLSVLWQIRPPGVVAAETKKVVTVPARAGVAASKTLMYAFTFSPRNPAAPNAKDQVSVEFVAEGPAATPAIAPKPKAMYTPAVSSYSTSGFPGGDSLAYWKKHPKEERQLFYWVEKVAPATFQQIVTTTEEVTKKGITTTSEISYLVSGSKDKRGTVTGLSIEFIGTLKPAIQEAPAGYHDKDYADLSIEKAQAQPDPKAGDRLGKLNLPAGTPAEEALAVKIAVRNYFVNGTRNAEVDAVVPIPNKPNPVFYTLRFRANNDVDVERVGERGPDAAAGQLDPNRLDIARSPEFAEKAVDVKTLKAWLKLRYPLSGAAGATVEELRTNVNTEVEAKADKPEWFRNYEITILDAKQADARLRDTHALPAAQRTDLKTFLGTELRWLEAVLETVTRKTLALFRGLRMARQRMDFKKEDKTYVENPKVGGRTYSGTNKTIVIFDSGVAGDPAQIIGGKSGVLPIPTQIFAHELGHLVEKSGVRDKFNKFVKDKAIKPFTHYAAEKPETDFFAETFMLFQTDPEWLRNNHPDVFRWLDVLTKTGTPPAR